MASAAADIKLLAGTANPLLADEVSEAMGIPLCEVDIKTFADGEREDGCLPLLLRAYSLSARAVLEQARSSSRSGRTCAAATSL